MTFPLQIDLQPNCLIVRLPGMFDCLSWEPGNGGAASASGVANLQVGLNGFFSWVMLAEDFGLLFNARSVLDDADGEWWEPSVKLKRIIVAFTRFLGGQLVLPFIRRCHKGSRKAGGLKA